VKNGSSGDGPAATAKQRRIKKTCDKVGIPALDLNQLKP
jgi:hypothetical protein